MASPDLSEFHAHQRRSKSQRKPCSVADALEKLDGKEREQLQAALDTPKTVISGKAISEWLAVRGETVHFMQIYNHRAKICKCHE